MRDAPDTPLSFSKMHGAGNDFVVVDSRDRSAARVTAAIARSVGDRHLGVGFDQLAEILAPDGPDVDIVLDFWNADGSMAGACGNATRCVADTVMTDIGRDCLRIRTARGVLLAERRDGTVWVNMGPPQLDWRDIPLSRDVDVLALPLDGAPVAIGMGNPHAVHFVENAATAPVERRGPEVEHDPLFPARTNVEFVSRSGLDRFRIRVWERGTGITLACGSGACATAVAAHLTGRAGRQVILDMDGGTLRTDWTEEGVWLTGPVARVFSATLDASWLERT